jgi:hypothetical protein
MFLHTRQRLAEAGFDAYEISNFAGAGGPCRHNDHYWLQGDYVGVGPGASSHRQGVRWTNLKPVEAWAKAVRAEVERRLLDAIPVPGWKLVRGRLGPRQWSDDGAVAQYLRKTVRLPIDEAYDLKLISPTSAEKLFKAGKLGARQWERLQPHITRVEGQPSVAPESDEREPFVVAKPSADDFADESTPTT